MSTELREERSNSLKRTSSRRKTRYEINAESRSGLLFVAPAILLIVLVVIYPLIITFRLSFFKSLMGLTSSFVGFSNYVKQLTDPKFWYIVQNTAIWTLGSVVFQMLIGLWAAIVVNPKFSGSTFFRLLFLLPWTIPNIVRAETWKWVYHPLFGVLNKVLLGVGVIKEPISWLGDPRYSLLAVTIENIWGMFPFVMLMVLAGLQTIPEYLYEAAEIDGASKWRSFVNITLPQLRNVLFAVSLLLIVWTANSFTGIYVMTKGGPADSSTTTSLYIYRLGVENWNFGMASTVAVLLFLLTLGISATYQRLFGERGEA